MGNELTTKERLLTAASRIFAEKGYRDATVADICKAAEANIAAVNYHFGDKARLYSEVWCHLHAVLDQFAQMPEHHEEIGAEAWLRLFMRSRLKTIFSESEISLLPQIICREMNEQTAQNEELFETYLKPKLSRVTNAVRDLLGAGFSEEQVELATTSYMGVHIFMNVGHQRHKDFPQHHRKFPAAFSEQLIQQVEDFAIGGLKAIKEKKA